jgi:hypothetical protein
MSRSTDTPSPVRAQGFAFLPAAVLVSVFSLTVAAAMMARHHLCGRTNFSPGRRRGRGVLFPDLGQGYLTAQRWPHIETLDCFCEGLVLVVGVDSSEVL